MSGENNIHRRVLDMLAGWSQFAAIDIESGHEDMWVLDAVEDLYQKVGRSYCDSNMTMGDARRTLLDEVLPILTGEKKPPPAKET